MTRQRYKDRLTREQRKMPLMRTPILTPEQAKALQTKHAGEMEILRQVKTK